MFKIKLPKQVHIIKTEKEVLGIHSSAFCFYNKSHAMKIINHIDTTKNLTIWNTPINPTVFLLQPGDKKIKAPRKDYKLHTFDTEEFFDSMLQQNISIRIIDNVIQIDTSTYSMSSFCGLDTDYMKTILTDTWKKQL